MTIHCLRLAQAIMSLKLIGDVFTQVDTHNFSSSSQIHVRLGRSLVP